MTHPYNLFAEWLIVSSKRDGSHWEIYDCPEVKHEGRQTVKAVCTDDSADSNCGVIFTGASIKLMLYVVQLAYILKVLGLSILLLNSPMTAVWEDTRWLGHWNHLKIQRCTRNL